MVTGLINIYSYWKYVLLYNKNFTDTVTCAVCHCHCHTAVCLLTGWNFLMLDL